MNTTEPVPILDSIPDPQTIRHRLAVAVTEAALLRAQLRISLRSARERDRLRHLMGGVAEEGVDHVG